MDTSATESENETKALGIDPFTGKKVKGRKKKDRDKLLKDKQNKKLNNKKLKKDRKDKLKMKQTKLQLQKAKNKLLPGKRTFQKRVRIPITQWIYFLGNHGISARKRGHVGL